MKPVKAWILPVLWIIIVLMSTTCFGAEGKSGGSTPDDVLIVTGRITNSQGKGVEQARVRLLLNGKDIEPGNEASSGEEGDYRAELPMPAGGPAGAEIAIEVSKPSYEAAGPLRLKDIVKHSTDTNGGTIYLANQDLVLKRSMGPAFWIAAAVLVLVYVLIALEFIHRTLAAFLGAAVLLFVSYTAGAFDRDYVILTFEHAMQAMDMNVIFLLMAMMMIIGVLKRTGLFQWLAFKSFQAARGNVFALSAILMVVTGLTSAFLDNVTTMILIIPVTINIASVLRINPLALLLPEVFASNVGGTATLIGDPPNIMIGSYAGLSFMDFVKNLSPIILITLMVAILYLIFWYKRDYVGARVADVGNTIKELRESCKITDKILLGQSALMLGITIFLFIIHGALHMQPSIAAMIGAAVLLVISRVDIVELLEHEIEWPTLIFFMMLFIIVAGAEETGLIQIIADWVNRVSRGSIVVAILVVLWVSAIASSIIDNIPFTATMLPIVSYLNEVVPGAESGVLWWALALGACLGGNGTMIGASANVVTVGIAESNGHRISFMGFMKVAFVPMIITVILSSLWLLLVMI